MSIELKSWGLRGRGGAEKPNIIKQKIRDSGVIWNNQAVTRSVKSCFGFFLISVFFILFNSSMCQKLAKTSSQDIYLTLSWLSCIYLEALWLQCKTHTLILLSLSQLSLNWKDIGHPLTHLKVLTVDVTTMSLILSLILNWVVISPSWHKTFLNFSFCCLGFRQTFLF